ncbi:MAG: acyl-ACP thioesterase domain-containing protein [Bacteroidota bacterium]
MNDSFSHWASSEKHTVRIGEIDQHGTMSFEALLHLLQEVAWNNSEKLGFSVYDLMKNGLTWVVNRMQFHVKEFPKHHEEITVKSWASGVDRLFTYRDYQVLNEAGKELLRGTSAWLILDFEKRRAVSTNEHFTLEFPDDIEQIAMNKSKIKAGVKPENAEEFSSIKVGFSDIDVNKHANLNRYVSWSLDHFYNQIGQIKKPAYVDLMFKGESLLGDELAVFSSLNEEKEALISIENDTKNTEAFLMKLGF